MFFWVSYSFKAREMVKKVKNSGIKGKKGVYYDVNSDVNIVLCSSNISFLKTQQQAASLFIFLQDGRVLIK